MLKLSPGWKSHTVESVVGELLTQADAIGEYETAARLMTQAALEFMLAGPRWKNQARPVRLRAARNGWRINDWFFRVLGRVDDESIAESMKLAGVRCDMDLLVPPWAAVTAKRAIQAGEVRGNIDVYGIDSYINLRMSWTAADMKMGRGEMVGEFLKNYGRLVRSVPEICLKGIGC